MASGKRQPSKQKRTNQNRQVRAARQARAAAAAAGPPAAKSPKGSGGSAAAPKGSLLGRLRGAATATPRKAPATPATAAATPATPAKASVAPRANVNRNIGRSQLARRAAAGPGDQPPGYRAALIGLIASVAAVVASFFIHSAVDVEGDIYTRPAIVAEWSASALDASEAAPDAEPPAVAKAVDDWMPHRGSDRLFLIYWPLSLAALLPILGAGLAIRAVMQRRPAKVVTRAMYATLLGAFLTLGLLQFFLPTVIAVSVAGYQVRKAEMAAMRAAAAEEQGDDDVIEAEVIGADAVEPDDDPAT